MRTGVYEILNNTSGKRYVGSAVYFSARWGCHKRQLRAGTHHSAPLQRAWNKYGEAAFSFNKILVCRKEDLLLYEQHLIDALKPEYNVAKRAGSTLGVKATPNAKRLLSKSMSERILTNPKKHEDVTAQANAAWRAVWSDPDKRKQMTEVFRSKIVPKLEKRYEFSGETLTRQQWADRLGVTKSTLTNRIQRWGLEVALTQPATEKNSRASYLLRSEKNKPDRVFVYRGEKMLLTDLAKVFGVTRQALCYHLKTKSPSEVISYFEHRNKND